jgi:hypothetical protein
MLGLVSSWNWSKLVLIPTWNWSKLGLVCRNASFSSSDCQNNCQLVQHDKLRKSRLPPIPTRLKKSRYTHTYACARFLDADIFNTKYHHLFSKYSATL